MPYQMPVQQEIVDKPSNLPPEHDHIESLVQDSTLRIYFVESLHIFSFRYLTGIIGRKIKES